MTDQRYLDGLVERMPPGLQRRLLEAYRQMVRARGLDTTELSTKLRNMLDEAVEETNDAPDPTPHS